MNRCVIGFVIAGLAVGLNAPCHAAPPTSQRGDDVQLSDVRGSAAAAISQLSPLREKGASVVPAQVGAATHKNMAASVDQLGERSKSIAFPPDLPGSTAKRLAPGAPIGGLDHCDAGAKSSEGPDCSDISENKSDELAPEKSDQAAHPVDPTKSRNIVDDVVNGGTGGVVALPPK